VRHVVEITPDKCTGKLEIFIAEESSYFCTVCGWIGWPEQIVELPSGIIRYHYPHPKRVVTPRA
jgi:hypothetical protein